MDHRTVILDGITTQHVGELVLDALVTSEVRGLCAKAYLQSLEDFSFGVLFGEHVTLSGRMPAVGDETPGATLLEQPEMQGFVVAVELGEPQKIADLLDRGNLRPAVERDLRGVAHLGNAALGAFEEFYVREARGYLGDDPSIYEPDLPPASYSFRTSKRPEHYVTNPSLQELVPQNCLTRMVQAIQRSGSYERVASRALNELVSRGLVTHIVNYWAFDDAVKDQVNGGSRLPYVTRAHLRKTVDHRSDADAGLKRQLYRGITRHALASVIATAPDRESFLEVLRGTRETRDFVKTREYLTELVEKVNRGKRKEADELLALLRRKAGEAGHEQETWDLSAFGVGVGGPLRDGVQKALKPGKYYLRKLIHESPPPSEYLKQVARVFPELRAVERS